MTALSQPSEARIAPQDPDQRVVLYNIDWWKFESMLAIRGDSPGVRLAYLEGALEIMSPSRSHEGLKKQLARLIEAYAEESGLFLNGYGSETYRRPQLARAIEPDECYVVGEDKEIPDLALEVIWTSGGINKRQIYAGLGVRELWEWQDGQLTVLELTDGAYARRPDSAVFPGLDLELLLSFLGQHDHTQAVRSFRAALQAQADSE